MSVEISFSSGGQSGKGGKLGGTVFFAIFLLMGLAFSYFVALGAYERIETHFWPHTSCGVLSSAVVTDANDSNPYRFTIDYEYFVDGRQYRSTQYTIGDETSSDYADLGRLAAKHRAGTNTVCFYDPDNVSDAVIEPGSLWFSLIILFPLIFVVIGAGGIYLSWSEKNVAEKAASISDDAVASGKGTGCAVLFFSVFLFAGLGIFIPFFAIPVYETLQARAWDQTSCRVISSTVRSHSSDDGTTYSVDILYSYNVDGLEYRSNRYNFLSMSTSEYDDKRDIVRAHPSGEDVSCYVDPKDPTEAVLVRDFSLGYLVGLLPLIFVVVGGGGIIMVLVGAGSKETPLVSSSGEQVSAEWLPTPKSVEGTGFGGEIELKAQASPYGRLFAMIFVAAFWNGIVSVFLHEVWSGWSRGNGSWFETLFLVPFVLVGLVLIASVFYYLLALVNPRPKLWVNSNVIHLGDPLRIRWEIKGSARRLSGLRVYLKGIEQARYRRGTSTYTDTETFAEIKIVNMSSGMSMGQGEGTCVVPSDTMHSFEAGNNEIIWTLEFVGEIKRWPDVVESYPLVIVPLRTS